MESWGIYNPSYEALGVKVPLIPILLVLVFLFSSLIYWWYKKAKSSANLAVQITEISKGIREMLSEYTLTLEEARWKPHLSISNRAEKTLQTDSIEAEITQKFKNKFEHDSISLLNQAGSILKKDCTGKKTQCLTGHFLLNEFCTYLISVAEELRKNK